MSAPRSASSSHDPHDQSSPHSHAASFAQISPWTRLYLILVSFFSLRPLLNDSLGNARWRLHISRELHAIGRPPLGCRSQVGRISKHLSQWHLGTYDPSRRGIISAHQYAAAAIQITGDCAYVLLGRHRLNLHYRLEQHRLTLFYPFFKPHRARDLERHFA